MQQKESNLMLENFPYDKTFVFLTGNAGTGKSTLVRELIKQENAAGRKQLLCATTGIAAINLGEGCRTINSVLGFFDTAQLEDQAKKKKLHKKLMKLASQGYRRIIIDEVSMMEARQVETLIKAVQEVNEYTAMPEEGLKVLFVGDFCQLPPVAADNDGIPYYAFKSNKWQEVINAATTVKLTKVWRQANQAFLGAINAARAGDEEAAAKGFFTLLAGEVNITDRVNITDYPGVTIVSKNKDVDFINENRFKQLVAAGKQVWKLSNYRWGKQSGEWKNIPEAVEICDTALVMVLANRVRADGTMVYANGSLGWVAGVVEDTLDANRPIVAVKLRLQSKDKELVDNLGVIKTGVMVRQVVRQNFEEEIEGKENPKIPEQQEYESDEEYKIRLLLETSNARVAAKVTGKQEPFYDFVEEKWVVGEVIYWPIRLAYASTVHKTQGLTLDTVQLDIKDPFFGAPGMMYVALSRVKDHRGLTIVGNEETFKLRCNASEEIREYV